MPKEFNLIYYMAQKIGKPLSRNHLLDKIWGLRYEADSRSVDVHISHLLDKIELDPKKTEYIKTIRGIGYKLVASQED
ncbi:winged helix-turn-helix domain-containing protein [Tumebacillus sp. ITR2]|uniref:Winged helix-turn-helix domain-containing protein n=2 Tax=Tumebacillus amylolyticus TaxID=2801339 RepID=A0ABS1J5R3_9BACL|nr:winged helix-turn-helix domain-containing protein [Tumebacillus amylolyticus]